MKPLIPKRAKIRKYENQWNSTNKEKRSAWNKEWFEKNCTRFNRFKETLHCVICGETETCCLDFHHRNPKDKSFDIGGKITKGWSFQTVLAEVRKCVTICRNCHAKVHNKIVKVTKEHKLMNETMLESALAAVA